MASKLKLKNNIKSELTIAHRDNAPAKTLYTDELAKAVATIDDMVNIDTPNDGDVCIVKDMGRGGTFIYDSSKIAKDNQGTNFSGWIRQYSGSVNVKWFGVYSLTDIDDRTQMMFNILTTFSDVTMYNKISVSTIYLSGLSHKKFSLKLQSTNEILLSLVDCDNISIENCEFNTLIETLFDPAPSLYSRGTILINDCSSIYICNSEFKNGIAGINVINSNNCKFLNNTMLEASDDINTTNNPNSTTGIYLCDNSTYNIISNNNIQNHGYGIGLQSVAEDANTDFNTVENNIIKNCYVYGIMLYTKETSTTASVKKNIISSNSVDTVYGSAINSVTGNKDFGAGIYLQSAIDNVVDGNYIANTNLNTDSQTLNPSAIALSICKNSVISNNVIQNYNYFGCAVYGGTSSYENITIIGNTFYNTKDIDAIRVNCRGVNITANSFRYDATSRGYGYAIHNLEKYVGESYNSIVINANTIYNMSGVNLLRSEGFIINNNYIKSAKFGIKIEDISYGSVVGNYIDNDGTDGVDIFVNAPNAVKETIVDGNHAIHNSVGSLAFHTDIRYGSNSFYTFRETGVNREVLPVGDTNIVDAASANIAVFDSTDALPDIDTIVKTSIKDNSYKKIELKTQNYSRTIKNTGTGAGQITLSGGVDATIPAKSSLTLEFNPSGSYWIEISRNF